MSEALIQAQIQEILKKIKEQTVGSIIYSFNNLGGF